MTIDVKNETKVSRLKFIDLARSIAILLMLEGHFTGAALSREYRKDEYILYNIWHNIHGLTSPLFFTVTGVIFVYLLTANNSLSFFKNIRVKKGFRRVLTLIFWGYFIQLSLWSISQSIYYGSEFHFDWLAAFHVLQSIGVGLFLVLITYGLYKFFQKGPVYLYYFITALIVFYFYAQLKFHINLDEELIANGLRQKKQFLPENAPSFIQNMFYGQYSDFNILRYAGYTLMGGMIGSFIRVFETKTREWWFGTLFIITGVLLSAFIQPILHSIDRLIENIGWSKDSIWELDATNFIRLGQVISLLGILMLVDAYFKIKSGLFLKIGQNTLPIYIVHVIILYGGIFGIGLKPYAFDETLGPIASFAISITAISCFFILVKYIEPLEKMYYSVKNKLLFIKHS
jgi:hypothetical protein